MSWMLIDLTLCISLLILAVAALYARGLQQRVVFFIAFGLLCAIAWARLNAPDLALAEAAIGAGLTGALLLSALNDETDPQPPLTQPRLGRLLTTAITALLTLALCAAVVTLFPLHEGIAIQQLQQQMPHAGVVHPVTAVLLNFRAWDTLLELAVLLCAALTVLNLAPARPVTAHDSPLTGMLTRILLPLLTVTAGYLLWTGAHAPGGAFQAGAVLAAATVVLRLNNNPGFTHLRVGALRALLALGLLLFLGVGLLQTVLGGAFLQYPPSTAGFLILLIEAGAMLSIACMLSLVYLGGHLHPHWPCHAPSNGVDTWKRHS
ncbi:hydrogen gas-evolving membrane-bound hydrogenase subunit E [Motiliproteus sediminis]|uniref:hydrogen gas-evolving membrane-bound hydrogenase subunit E n=1 Tax=Motiliproteus sediminis TaxID=1468178 RepID=UPI001AF02800|nr:hydrogen gas-evolving membrane-bound hydrogenase subunit E [Motiliproteus sediminis]